LVAAGYHQLYVFCPQGDHSNGAQPHSGVVVNAAERRSTGPTYTGGANNGGVVYKLTGSTEKVLQAFCQAKRLLRWRKNPGYGSLLKLNGQYYGTTTVGGQQQ